MLNINYIRCAFGPGSIVSRGLLFGAETASQNWRSEWDVLSLWSPRRKLHPRIGTQNGMCFPFWALGGNYVPEWDALSGSALNRKLCPGIMPQNGMRFPLAGRLESASQFERLFRDAVSAEGLNRKARPVPRPDSGTRFPLEAQKESASHSERQFRDAASAPNKRPRLAMELGPKVQHIQLVLCANSPSVMTVRALPYPR